ncbi:MAG: DUF4197 domain-containing protein, partial [Bacteroidetes bacterium]
MNRSDKQPLALRGLFTLKSVAFLLMTPNPTFFLMKRIWLIALSSFFLLSSCDVLYQVAGEVLAENADPTQVEIIQGLKDALTTGTGRAIQTLNQEGGYLNDPLVMIPFPAEAQFAANTLRDLGLGKLVDDFVTLLNRGAEDGAAKAAPIFRDAIREMTIADARDILLGADNAATVYFQTRTRDKLAAAFAPGI